jgi:NAD-dependent SIR2 family protein deacetylase
LHGYLRSTICTSCSTEYPRDNFQDELARLNPSWATFLGEAIASGALNTEDPDERRARGIKVNPDGDVDVPGVSYTTFRYPACPGCLTRPPSLPDSVEAVVEVDHEGAWSPKSNAGILKPAVVMFGESIPARVKQASEEAIDGAGRLLVLATSLATYSAWRLAKRALDRGMPIAVVNLGGVRGEDALFSHLDPNQPGSRGVRAEISTDSLLPALVKELSRPAPQETRKVLSNIATPQSGGASLFKDMLS